MVQEKDTHTHRLVEATKNMEEMGKKLFDSERVRQELRAVNQELRTMLEKMESKGTQIARLAKEKVSSTLHCFLNYSAIDFKIFIV
jgi:hypothetical protein